MRLEKLDVQVYMKKLSKNEILPEETNNHFCLFHYHCAFFLK